jgi:XTP/dITP diphosphohydrolase
LDLIVLATQNEGKARELRALLQGTAARVESLREHPGVTLPPETGSSYAENAHAKARAVYLALGVPALGDDSGLEIEALGGAPGLHSARYAGSGAGAAGGAAGSPGANADDRANIDRVLRELAGVPPERRTARFRCALALVLGAHDIVTAEGVCEGRILDERRGADGFGYDPVFLPDGEVRTFAELPDAVKNVLSHRARASALLRRMLATQR